MVGSRFQKTLGFLSAVLVAVGCGCGKTEGNGTVAQPDLKDLPSETVLVRVGTETLTKASRDAYADLRLAFFKLMDELSPTERERDAQERREMKFKRVREEALQSALPTFLQSTVIRQASADYVKKHGDYAPEAKKDVATWVEGLYASQSKRAVPNLAALRGRMKKAHVLEAFDRQVAYEQEAELFFRVACSNRYPIEEYVISNVYHRVAVNNYFAASTNRAILAVASNIVERIKAGEDFALLADEQSMDANKAGGGDMGVCTEHDFAGEDMLWEAVKDLPDGGTTGVVDAEDSWQILKVVSRDETPGEGLKLHLARIYFRRALEFDMPSRADVVNTLEAERRKQLIRETLLERLPETKVEFPLGREIFGDLEAMQWMLDLVDGKSTNRVEGISREGAPK